MKTNSSLLKETFIKNIKEGKLKLQESYTTVSVVDRGGLHVVDYNTGRPIAKNVDEWDANKFRQFLKKAEVAQILVNAGRKDFLKDGTYSVKQFVTKLSRLKPSQAQVVDPSAQSPSQPQMQGFMPEKKKLAQEVSDPSYFQDVYEAKYVLLIYKGKGGNDQETSAEIRSIPNVTTVGKEGKAKKSETSMEATFHIKFALERPEAVNKYLKTVLNPMLKSIKGLHVKNYLGVKLVKKAGKPVKKQRQL